MADAMEQSSNRRQLTANSGFKQEPPTSNTTLDNELCRVCNGPAETRYFEVIVCNPCKVFFRRNACKADETSPKCNDDGQCLLTPGNRRLCSPCRLNKCFAVGLKPLFRPSRINRSSQKRLSTTVDSNIDDVSSSQLVVSDTQYPGQQPTTTTQTFSTLNLLEQDKSSLTADHWTLLANLSNLLDIDRALPLARRFLAEHPNRSHPKLRFKTPAYYKDILVNVYSIIHSFIEKNPDFCSLSPHQRPLVLLHGSNNLSMFGGSFVTSHLRLMDNSAFIDALDSSYGIRARCSTQFIVSKLDFDLHVVTLSMATFAFSTSSYTDFELNKTMNCEGANMNDSKTIFRIQNIYAEVTWRYLCYRYEFREVIKRFDNIIRCLLAVQYILAEMENIQQHQEIINTLIDQTNQTLVLNTEE